MSSSSPKDQQGWITRSEVIIYVSLSLLDALLKFCGNALAWGASCSGTGTGVNRATLRICQDDALLYPLVLDLTVLLGIFIFFRAARLRRAYRMLVALLFFVYVLISSLLIWNVPFFMERIR